MKKLIASTIVLAAFAPIFALAATDVTVTSSKVTVTPGQTVTVSVTLNPHEKVYTSKVALSYSNDILTAGTFTFAPTWLALSQPGYDSVGNGAVIKTAGYPGGLSSSALFGTMTFTAIKAGTATITVTNGTQILDSNNQNAYSGTASAAQISVVAAPTTSVTPVTPSTPSNTPTHSDVVITPVSSSTSSVASSSATTSDESNLAATGSTTSGWMYALYALIVIVVLAIIYGIWRMSRNNR